MFQIIIIGDFPLPLMSSIPEFDALLGPPSPLSSAIPEPKGIGAGIESNC